MDSLEGTHPGASSSGVFILSPPATLAQVKQAAQRGLRPRLCCWSLYNGFEFVFVTGRSTMAPASSLL